MYLTPKKVDGTIKSNLAKHLQQFTDNSSKPYLLTGHMELDGKEMLIHKTNYQSLQ